MCVNGQARLLLEDPGCVEEVLGAWDVLLPAALARFGARLVLLQAFMEGFRTGLFVRAPVRACPSHEALHAARSGVCMHGCKRSLCAPRFHFSASARA